MATSKRLARLETLENRQLLTAMDLGAMELAEGGLHGSSPGTAEIDFVEVAGGSQQDNAESYDNGKWFVADSFSFGVEREMKESGEKGGTEDINIGVGELQENSSTSNTDSVDAAFSELGDERPTEEVAFYYNKIAFNYARTIDGKDFK